MPKRSIKLRRVLTLPFILLISLAILVTSYATWKFSYQATGLLGEQISKQTAYRIEEKLKHHLSYAETFNQSLKEPIVYQLIDVQNRTTLLDYIEYIVRQDQNIATLSFAYPDGSYMGISNTANGDLLKKIAGPDTNRMFYTYDLKNNKVIQQKANYDARSRPWFIEARTTEKPIWSSVFEMYSSGKLGITYSEALYDAQHNFLGVVGTDVVFHDLNEQLYNIRLTDNSYLFILDELGHVVAQSTLNEKYRDGVLYKVEESDNRILKQAVDFIHTQDGFKTQAVHSSAQFEIDGKHKDYFVNYLPYEYSNGIEWHIGVVMPKSDFLGEVNEVRTQTFVIWIVSFLMSVAFGLVMTYFINQAINRLRDEIGEVEETGYIYEHDEGYWIKEMSDLSFAFSTMSRRLHESYLDVKISNEVLENIVTRRTDSLLEANKQLQAESNTDPLTNLANRRNFNYFLQFYWSNYEENKISNLTLAMCDLDCFKQYNDAYGHIAGDTCLLRFAQVLKHSVPESHVASRYGGEEFAIIMPDTSVNEAVDIIEKLIKNLADQKITHKKSVVSSYMTVSIGIASTSNHLIQDIHELISFADIALYHAKEKGRNGYVVYDAP